MAWISFKVPTLITRSAENAGVVHAAADTIIAVSSKPESFLAIVIASLHEG